LAAAARLEQRSKGRRRSAQRDRDGRALRSVGVRLCSSYHASRGRCKLDSTTDGGETGVPVPWLSLWLVYKECGRGAERERRRGATGLAGSRGVVGVMAAGLASRIPEAQRRRRRQRWLQPCAAAGLGVGKRRRVLRDASCLSMQDNKGSTDGRRRRW